MFFHSRSRTPRFIHCREVDAYLSIKRSIFLERDSVFYSLCTFCKALHEVGAQTIFSG